MSGSGAESGRGLLYGVIAIVIGVVLALGAGLLLGAGGPGESLPPASPSPSSTAGVASDVPSPSTSPTDGASPGATAEPTPGATVATNPTPTPTATPNTNPIIVKWTVPVQEDCTGTTAGSIHVEWEVKNATGVTISIDGPGIYDSYDGATGSTDLPFGCEIGVDHHTYILRTVGGVGPAAESTKRVNTRAPSVESFVMPNSANCPTNTGSVAVAVAWEIRAATGVSLYRDGQLYANYAGKVSSNGLTVPYDCTDDQQVFALVTTGGYGEADEQTETVTRVLAP